MSYVGLWDYGQLSACETWVSALREDLSKGSYPVPKRVSEKTTENSERLSQQARPGF